MRQPYFLRNGWNSAPQEAFKWLNDQLLRMEWLASLVRRLVESGFGLDTAGRPGGIHFSACDAIRIFILLSMLIFSIPWVRSYFPPDRMRRILGGMRGPKANTMGALLGTLTPFCSCWSIPLFLGFTGLVSVGKVLASSQVQRS